MMLLFCKDTNNLYLHLKKNEYIYPLLIIYGINLRDMKNALIALAAILIVCAASVMTCPDKQAHKDAIMAVVNEKINEELKTDDDEMQGLSALFGSIGSGIAGRIVDNRLIVKNHFLWSTGEFQDLDGAYKQISVGVFGHIFTINKDDLDKAIDEAL